MMERILKKQEYGYVTWPCCLKTGSGRGLRTHSSAEMGNFLTVERLMVP